MKKDNYNLIVINKNLLLNKNKKINKKIKLLLIMTSQCYKEISFDIILITNYNIILGISYLIKYNFIIN